jgi:hypothetical protein
MLSAKKIDESSFDIIMSKNGMQDTLELPTGTQKTLKLLSGK